MEQVTQQVLSVQPEAGHDTSDVITIQQFIALLREEEDYWAPDQHNTKLMISRLRKIFYDEWGWNSELIRGAKNAENRYTVNILETPTEHTKQLRRFVANTYTPLHREVVYSEADKIYGDSRAGEVPFIYKNDKQELRLPIGFMNDIGHVLAGVDAYNHPQVVSPLPGFLMFMAKLFPHVDSNMDVATWLGDIASSSGDFLFDYLRNGRRALTPEQEQHYIDIDAPGSDMLGNIDAYIIAKHYDVGSGNGMRFTDILEDYYFSDNSVQKKRCSIFCEVIGLKGWNGESFANEDEWLKYYIKHLRNNICFQVFSLAKKDLRTIVVLLRIWMGGFEKVLKKEPLLQIWLKALKENVKLESK
jgi:hypothetical protein